jgi:hypothetical protein
MSAGNSEMRVVNHKNVNQNIINKAKSMIPKTLEKMKLPDHNIRVFYYIDKDKKIIGYIILQKILVERPQSLVRIIGSKIVYELSINISHQYQQKGYATDFFRQILDKIINKEGAFIYLIDSTGGGIGKKLYAGPKVVEKFDVYHIFNGDRGSYLIGSKTDKKRVHYVKLNQNDPNLDFYIARLEESNNGKIHLQKYLENNPPPPPPNSLTKY